MDLKEYFTYYTMTYSNGKIYKIYSLLGDEVYIGSTTSTLTRRLSGHKNNYNRWKNKNGDFISSCIIFEAYGFDNCTIELIELFSCESKSELSIREGKHIRENNCVNKNIAGRTDAEYSKETEQDKQQYRTDNAEKIIQYSKDYYTKNKDLLKEKSSKYHKQNRISVLEKRKIFRDLNKDALSLSKKQKVLCNCGCEINKYHLEQHRQSKKHLGFIINL